MSACYRLKNRTIKPMENKDFNLIINGVGGQGLVTLLKIISEAATEEKYEVRTSELHGLSQRGGAVEVHLRFGREIYSPLVAKGRANLILSLETQEALVVGYYGSREAGTVFLVNKYRTPTFSKDLEEKAILQDLNKISKKTILLPASESCKKELGTDVVAGIYLLGAALNQKLIPLKLESVISAIKKVIPEKYLELNIKALKLPIAGKQ